MTWGITTSGFDETQQSLEEAKPGEGGTFVIEADTEYAVHVEFGTINQQAQPFIRPAMRQVSRNPEQYLDGPFENVGEIAEQLAEGVAERARHKAPVDTGELRDSITVREV